MSQKAAYDVLVLAASAGGETALMSVLRELPPTFAVPMVVMQHLPPGSTVVETYGKRLPFVVHWASSSSMLEPRTILVCPPRSFLELLPDGSLRVSPSRGAIEKPMDRLLHSVARSFRHRAIAVVLTGMGADAAQGARDVQLAGGRVVVQSVATAQFPDMPRAAIDAGAADLVVALPDIALVLTELVAGTPQPQPRAELAAIRRVFGDSGEVAALARTIDWAETPLGPVIGWPGQLRDLVRLVVEYPNPQQLLWSDQQLNFFNDAAIPNQGLDWAKALGRPFLETFPEALDSAQIHARVLQGERVRQRERHFRDERAGRVRDTWFDVAYTPVYGQDGTVVGAYNTWLERTYEVLATRRLETLNRLASAPPASNRTEAIATALALLKQSADIAFVVAYLVEASSNRALLVGVTGVAEGGPMAPHQLSTEASTWPLRQVIEGNESVVVEGLAARFGAQASAPGDPAPDVAAVHPLRDGAEGRVIGAVVLGASPRLLFDGPYVDFLTLVGETISSKAAEASARQRENERLQRLAELDRAKTEFFANVSHEFRTPLTLLLAPLEEMTQRRDELPATLSAEIEVAARNSRRLLRLVDNLLDFSEIETRRRRAALEPTDLGELTRDVASAFRSAIERAGLRFEVQCDTDLPPVPVNREMWEKIVSNLLSNALKFTFDGWVCVVLKALSLHAELTVSDSGIGIPKQELPNIFKRFYRVRDARARSVEGSGMGLAIVHDLVARMGGQLTVRSSEGAGTAFTIWMPLKALPDALEESPPRHAGDSLPRIATELASEGAGWLGPDGSESTAEAASLGLPARERLHTLAPGARVLVVDDNADMRDYLRRLLGTYWHVSVVAESERALAAARDSRPDLLLADVMMPGMDGFQLLRAMRADEMLKHIPVVFLTARAGEDTAVEGLLAGADDYLAKPFSARELIARVGGQLELSRARRRAESALRASDEHNAFLLKLSDSLRPLASATEIRATAARILGEQLCASRAFYAEVDGEDWTVTRPYENGVEPQARGRHPIAQFGPWIVELFRAGKPLVIDDSNADVRLAPSERAAHAADRILGALAFPLVKEGKLVAVLVVHSAVPRAWSDREIALVEETAERTWAALELSESMRNERAGAS